MKTFCAFVVVISTITLSRAFQKHNYRSFPLNRDGTIISHRSWSSPQARRVYTSLSSVDDGKKSELAVPNKGPSLDNLLDSMPLAEKYSVLLQSYAANIMDNTDRTAAAMSTMETLFTEMLSKNIVPTEKSTQLLIDAASTFCNSIKLGQALQLSKAAGNLRAFGAANGQLTTPITSAVGLKALMGFEGIPFDDRESEVLYAGAAISAGALLGVLQVSSFFAHDLQIYSTLLGLVIALVCGLDVFVRQGAGLKLASAGLERLVLKDAGRDTQCDGAAFLVGYLLGLPCFCFRPDVAESLKMLRDSPESLEVYRQPKAAALSKKTAGVSSSSSGSGGGMGGFPWMKSATSTATKTAPKVDESQSLAPFSLPPIPNKTGEDMLSLSRVLVWLMAPVAAETLKYGKTIVSDPRRATRLLKVLDSVQNSEKKGAQSNKDSDTTSDTAAASASASSSSGVGKSDSSVSRSDLLAYPVPESEEDKKALLAWAYFEASALVKQYGDLLEEVNGYLGTGTTTVGECVMLVEEELR